MRNLRCYVKSLALIPKEKYDVKTGLKRLDILSLAVYT